MMTADQVRAWRRRHGLSQAAAATALGVSRHLFSAIELGRYPPSRRDPVVEASLTLRLAMAAYDAGIRDYDGSTAVMRRVSTSRIA